MYVEAGDFAGVVDIVVVVDFVGVGGGSSLRFVNFLL